jgi:hypothetical protein
MRKRVLALAAAMGMVFLLTAYARNLFSPHQLAVYDAYGKRVGLVSGATSGKPMVSFKFQDVPFMLLVLRDGFQASLVVWESTDCSGQPFIPTGGDPYPFSPSSLPIVAVAMPGNTVYVEDGTPRSITARSYSTYPGHPGPGGSPGSWPQCAESPAQPWVLTSVPARPLVDMNSYFTPPFTVH